VSFNSRREGIAEEEEEEEKEKEEEEQEEQEDVANAKSAGK
jgi:hypothetical protein